MKLTHIFSICFPTKGKFWSSVIMCKIFWFHCWQSFGFFLKYCPKYLSLLSHSFGFCLFTFFLFLCHRASWRNYIVYYLIKYLHFLVFPETFLCISRIFLCVSRLLFPTRVSIIRVIWTQIPNRVYRGKTLWFSWTIFNNGVYCWVQTFFTIPLHGIGKGFSDVIIYSFRLLVGFH